MFFYVLKINWGIGLILIESLFTSKFRALPRPEREQFWLIFR